MKSERDYLERTIATVRNHADADNCWPQWANIFADEIERLWKFEDALGIIATSTYPATFMGETKEGVKIYGGSKDASQFAQRVLDGKEIT